MKMYGKIMENMIQRIKNKLAVETLCSDKSFYLGKYLAEEFSDVDSLYEKIFLIYLKSNLLEMGGELRYEVSTNILPSDGAQTGTIFSLLDVLAGLFGRDSKGQWREPSLFSLDCFLYNLDALVLLGTDRKLLYRLEVFDETQAFYLENVKGSYFIHSLKDYRLINAYTIIGDACRITAYPAILRRVSSRTDYLAFLTKEEQLALKYEAHLGIG